MGEAFAVLREAKNVDCRSEFGSPLIVCFGVCGSDFVLVRSIYLYIAC